MFARLRPHLTFANVVAVLALFVALGSGAYAATSLPKGSVGTKQLKNGAVTTSKLHSGAVTGAQVARNSLTGEQVNAATLGLVPNATHAASADNATSATSASDATNADQLGGTPAAGYTHSDCNSTTGPIKGFAQIDASSTFSAIDGTQGVAFPYNCSGQEVTARRNSVGQYFVDFVDSPARIATATVLDASGTPPDDNAAVSYYGPGEFIVWTYGSSGAFTDVPFMILTP